MPNQSWSVVHQRLKDSPDADIRWRVRNWHDHPSDPGWERGQYNDCHVDFRNDASEGDLVFDVVFPRGSNVKNAPRVIRSALRINGKHDGVLTFDSFYFLDGDRKEGIEPIVWRNYREVDARQATEWMDVIDSSDAYNEYQVGERPESIPEEYWATMLDKTPDHDSGSSGHRC